MTIFQRAVPVFAFAGILTFAIPAACYGSGEHKEAPHHMENMDAMKAQHERMGNFKEAADMMSNAIIHNAPQLAFDGAEKLEHSLIGHEGDMPHKNRTHVKEFHRLFVELGNRTKIFKEAARGEDLPAAAVSYGRILEVCATCHGKFRD